MQIHRRAEKIWTRWGRGGEGDLNKDDCEKEGESESEKEREIREQETDRYINEQKRFEQAGWFWERERENKRSKEKGKPENLSVRERKLL